ncbi:hypothetical protein [Elioraea sp.]|uniref:hypothetical protein n=1 Tax=Elioraea sp. TaxID=2185103 RepID=UPI0025BA2430|nr:hypothetical protein [Elioraea sp.]
MMYRRTVGRIDVTVARGTDRTMICAWDSLGERVAFEEWHRCAKDDEVANILQRPEAWIEKHKDDLSHLDYLDEMDALRRAHS